MDGGLKNSRYVVSSSFPSLYPANKVDYTVTKLIYVHPRSAYTAAQRRADIFPHEVKVAWEPLPEDEAPGVDRVIQLAERLEGRLRAGEKVKEALHIFYLVWLARTL